MLKSWQEFGYEDFADGIFGNGGQNIYVSHAGFLQRIYRFDINCDGYADIFFANSHCSNERIPSYICRNVFNKRELIEIPSMGGYSGAVGDINGDGYDDLIIANQHNGVHADVTAYVYYGGPNGISEVNRLELPAPDSRAVAIGDFNGDGKMDIAFSSGGKLRIFYQEDRGFVSGDFVDLDIPVTHMTAADIDEDGYAELFIRVLGDRPRVLWGGPNGIDLERYTLIGGEDIAANEILSTTPGRRNFTEGWLPRILTINKKLFLFRFEKEQAYFYPVLTRRKIGEPLKLACNNTVSAAVGDINGDGADDIVVVCCCDHNEIESSWIYWGDKTGFNEKNRTRLSTRSARDVCIGDLDGDGICDIVICQGSTDMLLTTESMVFKGCRDGMISDPIKIITHDATCSFIGRTCDDENPQIIFINREGGLYIGELPCYFYYGGPDGFSPEHRMELPGWNTSEIVCCDFNDDGWPDILLCNSSENSPHIDPGPFLYWGGPEGFNVENKLIIPSLRTWSAVTGDFRHCGYLDIAVAGMSNPEIWIFKGDPRGLDLENPTKILLDKNLIDYVPCKIKFLHESFNNPAGLGFREPRWIFTADFNNDGWLDLFISQIFGKYCFILWGGPEGFSMERSTWLLAEGCVCAQAADLNGDGWLDLVLGSYQSMSKTWKQDAYIYIYWGGHDGFREDRRTQLPASSGSSLTIADFNNDGILDIFVGSYHAGRSRDLDSIIYWGAPGGVYTTSNTSRLFTHSASGCVALDFNEDGWIDLAVSSHKTYGNHIGFSNVWWNGPGGFSEKQMTLLPTIGPHGMTVACTGNIMDRRMEEYYISNCRKISIGAKLKRISWDAEIQPKTWVRAQIRVARSAEEISCVEWIGPDGPGTWYENGAYLANMDVGGCWIQYRLALGAVNAGNSPRVKRVSIFYEDEE